MSGVRGHVTVPRALGCPGKVWYEKGYERGYERGCERGMGGGQMTCHRTRVHLDVLGRRGMVQGLGVTGVRWGVIVGYVDRCYCYRVIMISYYRVMYVTCVSDSRTILTGLARTVSSITRVTAQVFTQPSVKPAYTKPQAT